MWQRCYRCLNANARQIGGGHESLVNMGIILVTVLFILYFLQSMIGTQKIKAHSNISNLPSGGIEALLRAQDENQDKINQDLKNETKEKHWIWWVFPSKKPGRNDSYNSFVTLNTFETFLQRANLPRWINWLKTAAKKEKQSDYFPSVDHGRILYFLDFWLRKAVSVVKLYQELFKACCAVLNVIETKKNTRWAAKIQDTNIDLNRIKKACQN